jgi:hypothetical protein
MVSVSPSAVAARATVTVDWGGGTDPITTDWIGLYAQGSGSLVTLQPS